MQIIKLHLGLIRYIIKELPKKKTPKEIVEFLKQIILVYIKELIKLYKNLFLVFDKDYQDKKNQFDKMKQIKTDLNRALNILKYVDNKMEKAGVNRSRRRQFWRDFYRDGQVRKDTFNELLNEINQIQ